ncbi:unnamed protein product [Nyctereutes procyonoides]|uniref:(raccoon dog) hypothetical protein n=1 Tax=Nyctereutes procyonoides TaxID=34880 RepID=A0A811XXL9_NYCPR|nr:unnamed protein product [Nyctereutes procyonoides]
MAGSSKWRSQGQKWDGSDLASLLHLPPTSLGQVLAPEAYGAPAVIPRPEVRGLPPWQLPPWQSHRLTQPGQLILPQLLTPLSFLPPAWHQKKSRKRNSLLMELGAFHIVLALLCLLFGSCLVSTIKSLHLVALKSWYPFCQTASFLISGILVIMTDIYLETYLEKILCLIAQTISFFYVLPGLFVITKDLFLESPLRSLSGGHTPPAHPPVSLSPNLLQIHIQSLELALLYFTVLEFFLLSSLAITVCRNDRGGSFFLQKDVSSLFAGISVEFRRWPASPLLSYQHMT